MKNKQGFSHFYEHVWVKKLVHESMIYFASWSIGIIIGKSMQIAGIMVRRKTNFTCLQESKWISEKEKELDNSGFKL